MSCLNAVELSLEDFGLRWQSAAATPLSYACCQSGVALRFPPQSKTRLATAAFIRGSPAYIIRRVAPEMDNECARLVV